MLHQLGCLLYSPPLESHIRQLKPLPTGHRWEVELRGASIWCVDLIQKEIYRRHQEAKGGAFAEADDTVSSSSLSAYVSEPESTERESDERGDEGNNGNEGEECTKPMGVNAILIDFLLYDTMKDLELKGKERIPHHRTRSIWY